MSEPQHRGCQGKAWHTSEPGEWLSALCHALPISLFVLGLFYYWFAVADRYAVFLYGHLGATPFDQVTSSRYWMAGLVASGALLVFYTAVNWLLGRLAILRHQTCRPPAWWRVWLVCVAPLTVGIPLITTTCNWPTLPPSLALACTVATLLGLALATWPGSRAALHPAELTWLAFDGVGLIPSLLLLLAIEVPRTSGIISVGTAWSIAIGSTIGGLTWLLIMTGLRRWRRKPVPSAGTLLVAGLCWGYLLLPLAHHLLATPPGYRYITAASNFFAFNVGIQLLAWSATVALAIGITHWRRGLR
jgi:hypothetical protein